MPIVTDNQLRTFMEAARRMGFHELMLCSSGNLSWRIDNDMILISQSGSWLPDLTTDQISINRLTDGMLLNSVSPSTESSFHFGILRERKEVNVILHFQSRYATTIACLPEPPSNFNVIIEVPLYIGPVAILPYLCPGTPEIGKKVTETIKTHDLVVLRNHGQVVVGNSFDDVIRKALFFELACGIILQSNDTAMRLTSEQITEMSRYKNK